MRIQSDTAGSDENHHLIDPYKVKEMMKKYIQEYALDENTKIKAVELYCEYMRTGAIE